MLKTGSSECQDFIAKNIDSELTTYADKLIFITIEII